MRKSTRYALIGAVVSAVAPFVSAENVLLNTPSGFQLLSLSPNGQWACGVQMNPNNPAAMFGFRWNLISGEIEMLGEEACMAYDVADDGTVSGEFYDRSIYPNGVGWTMPGYWRDGAWHSIEIPAGASLTDEGIGYGISADGHYMTGSLPVNGVYTAFIWKDGKIYRQLPGIEGKSSVGFAVSPDGSRATGFIERYNRTACYWDAEGNIRYLDDCEGYAESMFNYGRRFSPDGKKVLYWGGLEGDPETGTVLYCVYDTETGQITKVHGSAFNTDVEFNCMTDNMTLVGQEFGRGYIWNPETGGQFVSDWLEERGVSYGDIFYDFCTEYDFIPINNVVSISADEKVLAMRYLNKDMETSSLIVKLDQDMSEVMPINVSAEQMAGINTVSLKWKHPVGATVRGYAVYRDGKKISGFRPISHMYFYDEDLEPGTYEYEVSALSVNNNETKSEPITVTVTDGMVQVLPYNLQARQKGINSAVIEWEEPITQCIHKHYADPAAPGLSSLNIYEGIEVEAAVRYSREELSHYAGCKLQEVSFRPMSDNLAWMVNVYAVDPETNELITLAEEEIDEMLETDRNCTYRFAEPIDLPDADLVVGVLTLVPMEGGKVVGATIGHGTAGYSDLMRSPDELEDDFFSVTEKSMVSGNYMTISWAIDLGLTGKDGEPATLSPAAYNLYIDDAEAVEVEGTEYMAGSLTDGTHTLAVEALYADGSVSPRCESAIEIAVRYPAINDIEVIPGDEDLANTVTANWETPLNDDRTDVTYTTAKRYSMGIQAPEASAYEYMAASRYMAEKFRGYEGYEIRSIRFYPLTNATYTIMLVEGNDIVSVFDVTEYDKKAWNEVLLPEPVTVKGGKEYMLAIYVGSPTPATDGLGIDNNPPVEFYSDLFSLTGGQDWMSLGADAFIRGSWMMGLVMADPDAMPVVVEGYDVVIDNVVRNESHLSETSFTYDFGAYDAERHSLRVDAYYPARAEAVEGETTYFYLWTSGIESAIGTSITLVKGQNFLAVEGEDVSGLTVYDLKGAKAAQAQGNKVEISHLGAGVYIVEIEAAGCKISRKIAIN